MKRLSILAAFELEINKLDDAINKPVTDDSLYWLNQAINKFVKERFNGNAPHYTSYEQNEKRTKDLHRLYEKVLLKEKPIEDGSVWANHNQYEAQMYTWPNNLLYILNEDVVISNNDDGNLYDTSIFECTADNFMYRITNSLTDFHYKHGKARPLRVRSGEAEDGTQTVVLLNDKNYRVNNYWISYLRRPEKITDEDPDNADIEYSDFDDSVWFEIIKIAAQMYVENQSEPRYRTLTNEVLTQE